MPQITIPEIKREICIPSGTNLLQALTQAGIYPDAPCGGKGTCGKCKVRVDGQDVLACQTLVTRDMKVILPAAQIPQIIREGILQDSAVVPLTEGYLLAFDIGTTTLVGYLLEEKTGRELASVSRLNPQTAFGADVISRIQAALHGAMSQLTVAVRDTLGEMVQILCAEGSISPNRIGVISVVGNPAMQQLFLGIDPNNLAAIPFAPVLTQVERISCREILPICPNAKLLILPDISGYVGADTLACLLATKLYEKEQITLLVDIGTNGEMVLGNKHRMIACATAAGPALEGANIRHGMRAAPGAIDHVWLENGEIQCSVIGGGKAAGICGSGLIDGISVGLKLGVLNKRGKILRDDVQFYLTEDIPLTQEDIRQVQLAKGAIHAGIILMAKELGIQIRDIQKVQLAGAFGSFLNPASACRMGLIPEELADRIEAVGNAAGSGAKMLACQEDLLPVAQSLRDQVEFLELANLSDFPRTFARSMLFREECP